MVDLSICSCKAPRQSHTKNLASIICLGSKIERLIVEINIWQSTALVEPHMISMERLIGLAGTVVRPILCPAPPQSSILYIIWMLCFHTLLVVKAQKHFNSTCTFLSTTQFHVCRCSACLHCMSNKSCRERGSGTAQNKRIAIKRPPVNARISFSQSTQYVSKKRK